MNHYYKIRTPYDGRMDAAKLYGSEPRYFWVKKEAQDRCDDLNHDHRDDTALGGTFSILERSETLGKFDDADAKDVLGAMPPGE